MDVGPEQQAVLDAVGRAVADRSDMGGVETDSVDRVTGEWNRGDGRKVGDELLTPSDDHLDVVAVLRAEACDAGGGLEHSQPP